MKAKSGLKPSLSPPAGGEQEAHIFGSIKENVKVFLLKMKLTS